MSVTGLNHVNLRAPEPLLEALRDWYHDVLGLEVGPRPPFGSKGYWLYAGGAPIVHLSTQRANEPLRGPARADAPTTFDHVAFNASDPMRVAAHLQARHVRFAENRDPGTGQHQFFLTDPAGNGVELNFPWIDHPER